MHLKSNQRLLEKNKEERMTTPQHCPGFEQFKELLYAVPHMALEVEKPTMENSDYCNAAANMKNCYFCFNADYNEKCLYSTYINNCYETVDCYEANKCELCYECLDIATCYDDPAFALESLGLKAERDLLTMCADAWRWQSQNPEGFGDEND